MERQSTKAHITKLLKSTSNLVLSKSRKVEISKLEFRVCLEIRISDFSSKIPGLAGMTICRDVVV